ncbi:Glutathione S-transferase domain protein [Thalassoporum mexicanum PCC 7367]|uniref:glutathione S-transferase family protein n=1 Tax=Thalassoporum mexicanum TaxID=3457544 RepID=UPI00029FC74C|nr:glutathione S-transferase family protein [Pseudanabaena sp. PCC 7367]AFY70068.1 Glutathione S-transferase domain protein [Pseudanabaena sp. PCC 7367]
MLKLYGGARSRASIVQWYLEELAAPYEFVMLDMKAEQHLQPDYLAINPFGKVPGIVDGDFKLFESGAILIYLAEKYNKIGDSLAQRATLAQWVLFANSTLGNGLFLEASREKEIPRLLPPLNEILASQPFLMGAEFSAADVAVGSLLGYATFMIPLDFKDYPAIANYVKQLADRPAYRKSILKK